MGHFTTSTVPSSSGTEFVRSMPSPGPVLFAVAKVVTGTFGVLRSVP